MKFNIEERLNKIFENWEDKLDENEWYFDDAMEWVKELASYEAYELIPDVITYMLQLDDGELVYQTMILLVDLYYRASTTQIHPFLRENWDKLVSHYKETSAHWSAFSELLNWLRIPDTLELPDEKWK